MSIGDVFAAVYLSAMVGVLLAMVMSSVWGCRYYHRGGCSEAYRHKQDWNRRGILSAVTAIVFMVLCEMAKTW